MRRRSVGLDSGTDCRRRSYGRAASIQARCSEASVSRSEASVSRCEASKCLTAASKRSTRASERSTFCAPCRSVHHPTFPQQGGSHGTIPPFRARDRSARAAARATLWHAPDIMSLRPPNKPLGSSQERRRKVPEPSSWGPPERDGSAWWCEGGVPSGGAGGQLVHRAGFHRSER